MKDNVKVLLTAMAFIASFGIVLAQATKTQTTKSAPQKSCYIDTNNNNVCDRYEKRVNAKGNGVRCRSGNRYGYGRGNGNYQCYGVGKRTNYVDSNNNGICDHRENVKK